VCGRTWPSSCSMALCFAGIPAIGAAVVGWASVLAGQGKLSIGLVLAVAMVGAEAGGLAGYSIGARWGRQLLERPGHWQDRGGRSQPGGADLCEMGPPTARARLRPASRIGAAWVPCWPGWRPRPGAFCLRSGMAAASREPHGYLLGHAAAAAVKHECAERLTRGDQAAGLLTPCRSNPQGLPAGEVAVFAQSRDRVSTLRLAPGSGRMRPTG
jgi:hypothetical protein